MTAFRQAPPAERDLLVSVGIPTYGRPQGLDRTMRLITGQTWRNLEIVVSDNASPGPEVQEVLRRWSADPRVRVIRQPRNIGPQANFHHVLHASTGSMFMWASDDDEWHPEFIERCLPYARTGVSVMPGFEVLNRVTGQRWPAGLPELAGVDREADLLAFLRNIQPSILYGLHPRATLVREFRPDRYDFSDCVFVARLVLRGGVRTLPGEVLYCAGIDEAEYRIKYANPAEGRFDFGPFVRDMVWLLLTARSLPWASRRRLLDEFLGAVGALMRHHEGTQDIERRIRSEFLRAVVNPWRYRTA